MTLLAFKGTNRLHIYDRRDVRDDLLTQFNEGVAFLKKHLNVRSEIRGINREDIYEIPLEVLREALVNALMHRDYSITGTQISVEVYDDRVEIVNPGGLPKGLSLRDLGTVSIRRNELIADLFFRLHKVERIGMGIRKMKEAMIAAGLGEPTFATDSFFRAIFHRSPEFALKEKEGLEKLVRRPAGKSKGTRDQVGTKLGLSSEQQLIMKKLITDQGVTSLMAVTGRTNRTKFRDQVLNPLIEAGLVEMTIPEKPRSSKQRYHLTSKGLKLAQR